MLAVDHGPVREHVQADFSVGMFDVSTSCSASKRSLAACMRSHIPEVPPTRRESGADEGLFIPINAV